MKINLKSIAELNPNKIYAIELNKEMDDSEMQRVVNALSFFKLSAFLYREGDMKFISPKGQEAQEANANVEQNKP